MCWIPGGLFPCCCASGSTAWVWRLYRFLGWKFSVGPHHLYSVLQPTARQLATSQHHHTQQIHNATTHRNASCTSGCSSGVFCECRGGPPPNKHQTLNCTQGTHSHAVCHSCKHTKSLVLHTGRQCHHSAKEAAHPCAANQLTNRPNLLSPSLATHNHMRPTTSALGTHGQPYMPTSTQQPRGRNKNTTRGREETFWKKGLLL